MPDAQPGELIIVRFSPASVGGLTEDAETEATLCRSEGRPVIYSVSSYGKPLGDSLEDLIESICREAPVGGKTIWVVPAHQLVAAGFGVVLSEPPPNHYDLILGNVLSSADVERLKAELETGRRRNPAWKK